MTCDHFRHPDSTAATHLVGSDMKTFDGEEFVPETEILPGGICAIPGKGIRTATLKWVKEACHGSDHSDCPLKKGAL